MSWSLNFQLPIKIYKSWTWDRKIAKKTKHFDNKKSIPGEIKSIFHKFYGVSLAEIKQWT